MIRIKDTLGIDYKMNLDDVHKVKSALRDKGYYETPNYGMTPYPDERLFSAIKYFQKDNKLKVDGIIRPDGETIEALNKQLPVDPGVKRPDMKCPVCGGFHGGSMGDLCPDCASK